MILRLLGAVAQHPPGSLADVQLRNFEPWPEQGAGAKRARQRESAERRTAARQSAGYADHQSLGNLVSLAVSDIPQLVSYELDLGKLE